MILGILQLELLIHGSESLKAKRKVIKSVIGRVRNKFNVSAAEVGNNDLWGRSSLGFAFVGNDRAFINSSMDHVLNFIEGMQVAEIVDHQMEIINLAD